MSKSAASEWASLRDGELALERTEEHFALLVERQSRLAFSVAYSVLRNAEDAEDVVQDAFFKLYRSGAWKHMDDEKAFLARTVWRLAVSRRPSRRFDAECAQSEAVSEQISPETQAIKSERNGAIQRLIEALPERLRRPLSLSSIEDMSAREIAVVMDLPEGTVRRLIAEARALLKEKMARMERRNDG